MPVKLIGFEAYKNGDITRLEWATASEKNNKGFEIERSADGKSWTYVDIVYSTAENGNSSFQLDYSFTDQTPLKGMNLYRLKQVDFDGKSEYSSVKKVIFDGNYSVNVYPNPATSFINISGLNGNEQLKLYNTTGNIVYSQIAKDANVRISLSQFEDGMYYLQITDQVGNSTTHTLIKKN